MCWPFGSFTSLSGTCVFSWMCTHHFLLLFRTILLLNIIQIFFFWGGGVFQSQLIVLFCIKSARSSPQLCPGKFVSVIISWVAATGQIDSLPWTRKFDRAILGERCWWYGQKTRCFTTREGLSAFSQKTGRMSTCWHFLETHQDLCKQNKVQ